MTATGTEAVLQERGKRYGSFEKHAEVTQTFKAIFRAKMQEKWDYLADDQKEALEMIAHKLGRIVNGDPNYGDSWRDIAGYAQLVADRLEGVKPAQSTTLEDGSTLTAFGPADPHAELKKTWKPGQRWQVRANIWPASIWEDTIGFPPDGEPAWLSCNQYRRHPDDKDPPAPAEDVSKPVEKPWYPDDSGEWVEVSDDCMECPVDGGISIEVIKSYQRVSRRCQYRVQPAGYYLWEHPVGSENRIVAYKVVK